MLFTPGSTDEYATDTTALKLNNWYMVTTMYNSSLKKCSIYINGVLNTVTENVAMPAAGNTADMYIGRDNISNYAQRFYFKGTIDDVRIYNRQLTNSELKKLMARND